LDKQTFKIFTGLLPILSEKGIVQDLQSLTENKVFSGLPDLLFAESVLLVGDRMVARMTAKVRLSFSTER
jgi:hypothetical protein